MYNLARWGRGKRVAAVWGAVGLCIVLASLGTAWGQESMTQPRPWWASEMPERRPQVSLLGPTGYFDLLTSDSLEQGNFSAGLYSTYERVFSIFTRQADNTRQLTFERYSGIFSAAFGLRDNLELGLSVPGVQTDAQDRLTINRDVREDDVHELGLGKIRVGLKFRPAEIRLPVLEYIPGFAGLALEPFVAVQTQDKERGLSYPYRDQDTVYGINLLLGGQVGPVEVHWNFGYSRTDGRNVDNFLVTGSPFNVDSRGLSDGERISYALGFNVQPTPALNLVLEGRGDTSARHPWETRQDHRVNALVGAIYGLPNGLAVHAGWQVDLHDPTPDRVTDLNYRVIAGVTYSFAKPAAAPLPPPPPQPPPPPPPPPERRVERIVLQSVHFEFDKSRLTPLGRRVLDDAAERLRETPGLTVEIEGHTDSTGTEQYNLGLGQRRAEAVKGYLVLRHQIDPNRMTALSYGETRPIADNNTEEGRALNRRVEFKVLIR